ncbi:MAG TPA: CAP domain-containing protein [Longimicrobiales bacterium]|nr:CAP domain-containing protein [Longimicrobiales bacterium]
MLRAAIACLLCVACSVPIGTVPSREPAPVAPPVAMRREELAKAVLVESNRARTAQGLPELAAHASLDRAAMQYAEELAERRTLSHQSPVRGRETLSLRVEAEGVRWRNLGENLASMSGLNVSVPRQTIEMWLNSPGHRSNMLDAGYSESGVGVARGEDGLWYVVQIYMVPWPNR